MSNHVPSVQTDQPVKIPVNKKRLLLFKVMALLVPFLLLLLLEGYLRLIGYGHDLSLFVEDPQKKGFLVMNKHASEKYFTKAENATIGNQEIFRQVKTPGTFRVFVLGESTTIGYPYFYNGSFHRWLQYRLMHTFPEKNFEIINVSLTAVNSYTVLGFAREIVNFEPDAVLVYTGHNEYYGALGVGSTSTIASNPYLVRFILKLREFRLTQLISQIVMGIKKSLTIQKVDLRENLMKRMAARQQIVYNSKEYNLGVEQFKTNVNALCRLLSQHHVPVFISNLVSNEKDLKPFISLPGNSAKSAQYLYQQATDAYNQKNFKKAKQLYIQAKEMDLLRFRAPEALNLFIQELPAKYPGVHLVDAKKSFEQHSPQGIIGKETILEHVHPNLYGYAILSNAFYQAMKEHKLIENNSKSELDFKTLLQQMPITMVDSLKGAYEIMMLKEGWPFNEPMLPEVKKEKTTEESLAGAVAVKQISWGEAMNRLLKHYLVNNNQRGALKVTEALLLNQPYDREIYVQAGKLSMNLDDYNKAAFYLKKAFDMENNLETAQSLYITMLKADKPEEAMPYLSYAASQNQSNFPLSQLQLFVQQLIALKSRYQHDTTNINLSNQLAAGYLQFANTAAASKYINKSLRLDSDNGVALQLKKQVQAILAK
ncbi:GSCFA domain-containing protein [Adhaeribacter radiodurans]|uniref:SGNH/GDSL hydrolase family protein n=1 Tax=Adhaeribacter radiodurans TaxID=2745197 RepID=A0A7L7L974_9BACT|nr:hypothetical protein [Adhaeribacter radiodurans]QMU29055.1 hypothetical protein HUW48_13845 [Adhaeribacter radiodurans]